MLKKFTLLLGLIVTLFFASNALYAADTEQKIANILEQQEAPSGVVFEIATSTANSLQWALPKIQNYIKRLRERFPTLEIAIVTHGDEQFSLQKSNNEKYKKVHSLTQQLVNNDNVPLHVCGTYAGWKNVSEEEFPDYVDVTAEGPATINDYLALGYTLIKIKHKK